MWFALLVGCAPMGAPGGGGGVEGTPSGAPAGEEPGTVATGEGTEAAGEAATLHSAVARLEPRSESAVTGTVTFRERRLAPQAAPDPAAGFKAQPSEVSVTIELVGAPPGEHAVHVHEFGDCSAPDAT